MACAVEAGGRSLSGKTRVIAFSKISYSLPPDGFGDFSGIYSPRQNDVISTKIISELFRKNMSSQLQQINSPRINLISTFLSQQFWAGFGSGRARWVRASPVSALSSWIPQTRCQQKNCHFEKSETEISQQKILAELFSKKCHLILNN